MNRFWFHKAAYHPCMWKEYDRKGWCSSTKRGWLTPSVRQNVFRPSGLWDFTYHGELDRKSSSLIYQVINLPLLSNPNISVSKWLHYPSFRSTWERLQTSVSSLSPSTQNNTAKPSFTYHQPILRYTHTYPYYHRLQQRNSNPDSTVIPRPISCPSPTQSHSLLQS